MFTPNIARPSREEEESVFAPSGIGDYLLAKLEDGFMETTSGAAVIESEAYRAEKEEGRIDVTEAEAYGFIDLVPKEIVNMNTLSESQWKSSKYYREGMEYSPSITEARMKVYADYYDDRKKRERTIERRNAGMLDGTLGFGASLIGSIPDPVNLVSFGAGGTLAAKVAKGAAANLVAEGATQLATAKLRAEAGIAPTMEERLLNGAFAAIVGAALPAIGHVVGKVVPEGGGRKSAERVEVEEVSSRVVDMLPIDEKVRVLDKLKTVTDDLLENPPFLRDGLSSRSYSGDAKNEIMRELFGEDAPLASSFIRAATGEDSPELIESLLPKLGKEETIGGVEPREAIVSLSSLAEAIDNEASAERMISSLQKQRALGLKVPERTDFYSIKRGDVAPKVEEFTGPKFSPKELTSTMNDIRAKLLQACVL